MIISRIPGILSKTFKSVTWELPSREKVVYLTFDDGPTPGITEWVLNELEKYDAKATFFCLGKNVEAHPDIYRAILERGHAVGNHSYSHLKGFGSSVATYVKDAERAAGLIDSRLFRPPYGRILKRQVTMLKKQFHIIMWSVLSVDYNSAVSGSQVVKNVLQNVKSGSIVVFHDSLKAEKNLRYALPEVLHRLKENGYSMQAIVCPQNPKG